MDNGRLAAAAEQAAGYIDALTVDSPVNVPEAVVAGGDRFFTWDNEKRRPPQQPYLFQWSYYNGVVMEGLFDIYRARPDGTRYLDYVRRYLDAMVVTGPDGHRSLSRDLAGYVDCHGADCYKTASLLLRASDGGDAYMEICRDLYRDLTDMGYVNSTGHTVPAEYTVDDIGGNYWHTWAKDKPPKFRVWLDGLYMLQPFIARYAALTGDTAQLELVNRRLDWAASEMLAPNGLYYHASNGGGQVCPFHWTRAMGWYGMAMADVTEVLPEKYTPGRAAALRKFVDGMLRYQHGTGLWANVADQPVTETNRLEVSGTAMMVYTILKGVRMGWLDRGLTEPAVRAFVGIVENKLTDGHLRDIYLKASANGSDNYQNTDYYMTDEGKGAGPFIMAYSETLYL